MITTYEDFSRAVERHGLTPRQYQRNLVRMGTTGVSNDDQEAITDLIIEARKRGDANTSVWHVSAAYFGTKCHCAKCIAA